jgi:hypothetical protein
MKLNISEKWTAEERIAVASALLGLIQTDIYSGTYSSPGRPNITSVLHVLHEDAEVLNQFRESLETILGNITKTP